MEIAFGLILGVAIMGQVIALDMRRHWRAALDRERFLLSLWRATVDEEIAEVVRLQVEFDSILRAQGAWMTRSLWGRTFHRLPRFADG